MAAAGGRRSDRELFMDEKNYTANIRPKVNEPLGS